MPCHSCNKRMTSTCSIIGGPNDDGSGDIVLYTVYGGHASPREVFDPSLQGKPDAQIEAARFWGLHALAR